MRRTRFMATAIVIASTSCLTGCSESATQTRIKSPIELMHSAAFGGGLTKSEYTGSDHARDWAMAREAEAVAKQSQQFAASMAAEYQQQAAAANRFNQAAPQSR
ncbi:MAG: hypothetical protein AB8G99_18895 [Planctomycetaceae bacterium]